MVKIKRLKGYSGRDGQNVYECTCGALIEAYSLVEAYKKHKHIKADKED